MKLITKTGLSYNELLMASRWIFWLHFYTLRVRATLKIFLYPSLLIGIDIFGATTSLYGSSYTTILCSGFSLTKDEWGNFLFDPDLKLFFFLGPKTKFLTYLASLEVSLSNLALPSSPAFNTVKWQWNDQIAPETLWETKGHPGSITT